MGLEAQASSPIQPKLKTSKNEVYCELQTFSWMK